MFSDIFYSLRNSISRIVILFPLLWWSILKFSNHHFICSVVRIIRDDQNRILLLEHKYRPDPLALPAGWLKKGETPFEALKRELKEETNFEIIPQRILNVIPSKKRSHMEIIISAFYKSGEFLPNKEISSYSWVEESEIQNTIDNLTTIDNTVRFLTGTSTTKTMKEEKMETLKNKKRLNLDNVVTYDEPSCAACSVCICMWPASTAILVAMVAMAA